MANVSVYNMEGKEVGTMELNDAVFGVEVNDHLVHLAVVRQLANNRQGTQKAKTRSEVSGGGRKPWRQKVTGHARQGSTRAPQWTGGGVVFAPTPRDYSVKMNKIDRRLALKSALTIRVQENKLIVLDELKLDVVKTKAMQNVLNNLNVSKAMVVLARQLANNRQGTQKAKTRSEVSGGGRKPWRQKGTGHARQGSTRAPQWTGGGVVFAPTPRDYSVKMNKKERRLALKSALTSRVQENKLIVLDELKLDEVKTKAMQNVLNNLNVSKAMVVLADNDANVVLSARNIPGVITALPNTINVYDVLKYNTVILTKASAAAIEEVYA